MRQSYDARAKAHPHPLIRRLFNIMESKRSNLAISADVKTSKELLHLAEKLGPYVAIFKTHVDIVIDFDSDTVSALRLLSERHNFLVFEDRKFIDIGNTAKMQYSGALQILDFAHFVNASILGGPGVITGLQEAAEDRGLQDERGLLLLAEMSTRGSLAVGSYTEECIDLALKNQGFVTGFVSLGKLPLPEANHFDFVTFTTGISSSARIDPLGQQYQTPSEAIARGSDIVIVGRGIYGSENPEQKAKEYQIEAWKAYETALRDA